MAFLFLLLVSVLSAAPAFAEDPAEHLSRGLVLAGEKYPEEAAAEFDRYPNFTQLKVGQLKLVAQAYFDAGKVDSSLRVIAFALTQERVKRDKGEVADFLRMRGDMFSSLDRRNEAVSAYKQAAATDPGNAYTFWGKAGLQLMLSNKCSEALPLLKKGLKPGDMNGFVYQDIGRCYWQLKQPGQAITPLLASVNEFDIYRKKKNDAFMKRLIQSYNLLIQCYEATANQKEALVWKNRRDALVGSIDLDLFGKP